MRWPKIIAIFWKMVETLAMNGARTLQKYMQFSPVICVKKIRKKTRMTAVVWLSVHHITPCQSGQGYNQHMVSSVNHQLAGIKNKTGGGSFSQKIESANPAQLS
jgi:hypothetical protein